MVLALAEAAQNIVKHAYSGQETSDSLKVEISFDNNQLKIDLYDKGDACYTDKYQTKKC